MPRAAATVEVSSPVINPAISSKVAIDIPRMEVFTASPKSNIAKMNFAKILRREQRIDNDPDTPSEPPQDAVIRSFVPIRSGENPLECYD
jgi:hypothetical protein